MNAQKHRGHMRAIAFLSRKGGSGKTTIAVHMAVAAQASGEQVLLIDTDPQASAIAWSQARTQERPDVAPATAFSLARVMEHAQRERMTLVVIDTAPHTAPGVDTIVAAADFLLI